MATFAVHGKMGTGKSKYSVYVMREAMKQGRRVACNFPLFLDKLLPGWHRISYTRIPDRPSVRDLIALGPGNPDSYDEEKNGVLVLDELAVWLNSRTFQEKERNEVLHWLVHARKYGWNVYFLCQNPMQIDRQVRESLLEYSVTMRALDKVRLPVIGLALQLVGLRGTFPKGVHASVVKLGFDPQAPLVEKAMFKGVDLHEAYDTRHVFVADPDAVPYSELGPHYFLPLPARRMSWLAKIAASLRGEGARNASSSRRGVATWPESVMRLPPETRWQLARSLASRADWAGVGRCTDATVRPEAANHRTFQRNAEAKVAAVS